MADERIVRIKLDGSGARLEAGRTNAAVKGVGSSADSATKSMFSLSKAAAGVITALATSKIIQYADAWTNVNNRLKAATNNTRELAIAQDGVLAIAQEAGVELNSVADAYSRISQATSELGVSQERVLDVTRKVTLALKAGGATGAETASVMMQLGQALGSGALQGDELRSILEASIPVSKALAKEFDTNVGSLKKLGAEGKLTSDRVVAAIENMDEKALTFTKDISSGFTTVNNALAVYVGRMDESLGASENVAGVLSGLAQNMDEVIATAGRFIQLGLALYLTNITKAVAANTVAFTANQAQIIRYNTTLAASAGVGRVAAASTWALTYAMRALKAALPFGVILLGLEVMQRMLTSTNDQIAANDRYSESTRKLNARLETRAEKEAAIALRTAAEVNIRNQDKLLTQQEKIDKERLKLEKANAAEAAKIRGDEYDEADKLSLYQITKTRNRISVMEEESRRLQAIADKSQAAFTKLQGAIGGEASEGKITKGVFTGEAADLRGASSGLDSFFNEENVFSGSDDLNAPDKVENTGLTEKLQRENQMIQDSLLARQQAYSDYYAATNSIYDDQFKRQRAKLELDLALQAEREASNFQNKLQSITDRNLAIQENESVNEVEKQEAAILLNEQKELLEKQHQDNLNQITKSGAEQRAQIERAEKVQRISEAQNYANAALQISEAFGSKSEKADKKRRKTAVVINTAAGIGRAFAEHNFYEALGISAAIAANGISQISAINSAGGGSGVSSPSGSGAQSIPPTAGAASNASTQTNNTKRIIDLRGFDNGGYLTKEQLTELLAGDEDVIIASNNGQKQGARIGAINNG